MTQNIASGSYVLEPALPEIHYPNKYIKFNVINVIGEVPTENRNHLLDFHLTGPILSYRNLDLKLEKTIFQFLLCKFH